MFYTRRKRQLTLGAYGPLNLLKCRLPLDSFDTHMYIVGKTKKGKSKFLEHTALQLITMGQGCGLAREKSASAGTLCQASCSWTASPSVSSLRLTGGV